MGRSKTRLRIEPGARRGRDGDGDLDLVSTWNSGVVWLENRDGAGYFGAPQEVAPNIAVTSLLVADVDGDDDADVLAASTNEDRLVWYENRPAATEIG